MGGYFYLGNQRSIPFTRLLAMFPFSFRIREKYQFCSVVTSIISFVSENNNIYSATCECNWDPFTRFVSFAGHTGTLLKAVENWIKLQMFDVTLNTNSLIIIFFCVNKNVLFFYIQKEGMKHEFNRYGVAEECYKIFIIRLAKRFI